MRRGRKLELGPDSGDNVFDCWNDVGGDLARRVSVALISRVLALRPQEIIVARKLWIVPE